MPHAKWLGAQRRTILLALAGLGWAAVAAARDVTLTRYDAPPGCPARQSAEEALRAARPSSDVSASLSVRHAPPGYQGRIDLVFDAVSDARGSAPKPSWSRDLSGSRCDELVAALALSAAIHLDEQRRLLEAPPPSAAVPGEASSGAGTSAGEAGWGLGAFVGGDVRSGLSPGTDLSLSFGVSAARDRSASSGYFAYSSLSLQLHVATTGAVSTPDGLPWDHGWWALAAETCPWSRRLGRALEFAACAAVDVGRYSARIQGADQGSDWIAFTDLIGSVAWRAGAWASRLRLGAVLPIDPLLLQQGDLTLFRQGAGWVVGLSVGIEVL